MNTLSEEAMNANETGQYYEMVDTIRMNGERSFEYVPPKSTFMLPKILMILALPIIAIVIGFTVSYKVHVLASIQAEQALIERMAFEAGYDNPSTAITYILRQELRNKIQD